MILISSMIQIGAILSAILGTQLYASGGWLLVGLGVASFNILPLIMLPFIKRITVKQSIRQVAEYGGEKISPDSATHDNSLGPQPISRWSQKIAFYFPDFVLFLNNVVVELIAYVLPARIVASSSHSITSAVPLFRIFTIASLVSALTLSFVAGKVKKYDVFCTMAIGNMVFHCGAVLAFGATTYQFKFMDFTCQLVVGLVLMGLGEACHLNLCIPSKFVLYEKWTLDKTGLGQHASKIFNIFVNTSGMMGTVISALSLSEESELPTVAVISGLGVTLTLGILLVNRVQ